MNSLFQASDVIKLKDKDFILGSHGQASVKHHEFHNKDGYIMAFWSACGHCQAKENFWSYLASQFNKNPQFKHENFRIGVIDVEDPETRKIREHLDINGVPRFYHVVNIPTHPDQGRLTEYQGTLTLEGFLGAVCQQSANGRLCHFNPHRLHPPSMS